LLIHRNNTYNYTAVLAAYKFMAVSEVEEQPLSVVTEHNYGKLSDL
jgi:hypothetical protein